LNADDYKLQAIAAEGYPQNIGAGWGVFFDDGSGYGVFQHADYRLVTADAPAQPGEVIIAYCTNLDSFSNVVNAPPIGSPAQADPLPSLSPNRNLAKSFAHILVNGNNAELFYAGLTPAAAGLFQINFRVPADTPNGDALVYATNDTGGCVGSALCPNLNVSKSVKLPVRQ
jgi:uncharacterized protein (TIGR03437 family)